MLHHIPTHLPRPDGTKDVFCEMSYRRVKPCTRYVKFTANDALLNGYAVYKRSDNTAAFVCSATCLVAYARNEKER